MHASDTVLKKNRVLGFIRPRGNNGSRKSALDKLVHRVDDTANGVLQNLYSMVCFSRHLKLVRQSYNVVSCCLHHFVPVDRV